MEGSRLQAVTWSHLQGSAESPLDQGQEGCLVSDSPILAVPLTTQLQFRVKTDWLH
jgi:hypothetical protein